jgi:hypothetical protein
MRVAPTALALYDVFGRVVETSGSPPSVGVGQVWRMSTIRNGWVDSGKATPIRSR